MTTAIQECDALSSGPAMSNGDESLLEFQCQSSNECSSSGSPSNLFSGPSPSNVHSDDPHVYTNLKEIEELNSRPVPPIPEMMAVPKRDLRNGWFEFETDVGRTYFHNMASGKSQWIPPRFIRTPAQVQAFLNETKSELDEHCTVQALSPTKDDEKAAVVDEVFDEVAITDSDEDQVVPMQPGNETVVRKLPQQTPPAFQDTCPPFDEPSVLNATTSMDESIKRRLSPGKMRSLSFNNRSSVLKNVPLPQVLPIGNSMETAKTLDRKYIRERCSSSTVSDSENERRGSVDNREPVRTIRCGDMERCELRDDVVKPKKKEWVTNYMYLTSAHLILYKDQKSAEKNGKHYDAPLGVWDLKGASIAWHVEKEKKKRRGIQLELSSGCRNVLRTLNDKDTSEWFTSLRDVIAKLPSPPPSAKFGSNDTSFPSVVRNFSTLSMRPLSQSALQYKSGRTRSRTDVMTQSAIETGHVEEVRQSKESILEKLRRFFRTRPTVESLKEKGIYKAEPVFGSTLPAICAHENSLVPKFIRVIIEVIESKGLNADGIYRLSANMSAVQKIRLEVDQDIYNGLVAEQDVYVLACTLKLFFRELSEPLFPTNTNKEYVSAMQIQNPVARFKKFEELLGRLPDEHRETLKAVLKHLNRVTAHSATNRMTHHGLAILFGPNLFQSEFERKQEVRLANGKKPNKKVCKPEASVATQSNSHLAFTMIMQGQITEFLLKNATSFDILKTPVQYTRL